MGMAAFGERPLNKDTEMENRDVFLWDILGICSGAGAGVIHKHHLGPPQAVGDAHASTRLHLLHLSVCLSVCQALAPILGWGSWAVGLTVESSCPDRLSLLMASGMMTQDEVSF